MRTPTSRARGSGTSGKPEAAAATVAASGQGLADALRPSNAILGASRSTSSASPQRLDAEPPREPGHEALALLREAAEIEAE